MVLGFWFTLRVIARVWIRVKVIARVVKVMVVVRVRDRVIVSFVLLAIQLLLSYGDVFIAMVQ